MLRQCIAVGLICTLLLVGVSPVAALTAGELQEIKAWDGATTMPFELLDPDAIHSAENPYVIDRPEKLAFLALENESDLHYAGKFFKQTADFDLQGHPWTPIGKTWYFQGTYDGDGHTIANLMINDATGNDHGLFGVVSNHGQIMNVSITNAAVSGNDYVGGVAGRLSNATISNCLVTGMISGAQYVGGVAGLVNFGEVAGSHAKAQVIGSDKCVGGLIGAVLNGNLTECSADCQVQGEEAVGGFSGELRSVTCVSCYSQGRVTGLVKYIGGFTGVAGESKISNCYSVADVSAAEKHGIGSFVGFGAKLNMSYCYGAGQLDATDATGIGGFLGIINDTSMKNAICYYDKDKTGRVEHDRGVPKTTAQMTSADTFTGWPIEAYWLLSTENTSYPRLRWQEKRPPWPAALSPEHAFFDKNDTAANHKDVVVTQQLNDQVLAEVKQEETVLTPLIDYRVDGDTVTISKSFLQTLDLGTVPIFFVYEYGASQTLLVTLDDSTEKYRLTLLDSFGAIPTDDAQAGALIALDAGTRKGYRFTGWSTTAGHFDDTSASKTLFTMPASDATVTAHWKRLSSGGGQSAVLGLHDIVLSPKEGGHVQLSETSAAAGTPVRITALPNPGMQLQTVTVCQADGDILEAVEQPDGTHQFIMPSQAVTIDALFVPASRPSSVPFVDILPEDWFYEDVVTLYDQGLFKGTAADRFGPHDTMNRAMLVTVLHRQADDAMMRETGFVDVAKGIWYEQAVAWAHATGVAVGFGDGRFGPDVALTREQIAAILWNAKGKPQGVTSDSRITFADEAAVSEWAKEPVQWAVANRLLRGDETGHLHAQQTATRAECCAILLRYMDV